MWLLILWKSMTHCSSLVFSIRQNFVKISRRCSKGQPWLFSKEYSSVVPLHTESYNAIFSGIIWSPSSAERAQKVCWQILTFCGSGILFWIQKDSLTATSLTVLSQKVHFDSRSSSMTGRELRAVALFGPLPRDCSNWQEVFLDTGQRRRRPRRAVLLKPIPRSQGELTGSGGLLTRSDVNPPEDPTQQGEYVSDLLADFSDHFEFDDDEFPEYWK